MRLWVRMEHVPSVVFLILKSTPNEPQLVSFHLSLPMGCVYSSPYLCIATETLADLDNAAMAQRDESGRHSLEESTGPRAADDTGASDSKSDASW